MNRLSIAAQLRILVALALLGVTLVIGIGWIGITSTLSNQLQLQRDTRPLDEAGRVIAESLDGYSRLREQMRNADSVAELQAVASASDYREAFTQQLDVFASSPSFMDSHGDDVAELRERLTRYTNSYERIRPELKNLLSQREDLISQVEGIAEFFGEVEADIEGLFGEALANHAQGARNAPIDQVDHAAGALARAIEVSRSLQNETEAQERVNEIIATNQRHHEQLWETVRQLADDVNKVVERRIAESQAQVQNSLMYFLVAGIVVALLMTVPLYFVSRWLHQRIAQLRDEMTAMQIDASTIDISRGVSAVGNNELSSLAGSINDVLRSVRGAITEVLEVAQAVEQQAEHISESTQRSREMAQTQSSQAEQIATAMQQMVSTVQEVSSNAQIAHQHTTQAAEQGLEIKDIAEAGVNEMGRLSSTMDSSHEVVNRLAERSEEVGSITASIQEVADQTNLLSLNAAIEAARAGQEGRGFAVVAEEVRNLATNTQDMTRQIHSVIESLRGDARDSAKSIHAGREQASRSAEEVERIKATVASVHSSLSNLEDQVSLIAAAAEEQSATAEEVNRNVQGLNDLASENAHVIDKLNEGGRKLTEVAKRLKDRSQRFRL